MEKAIQAFAYIFGMSILRYFLLAGIPFILFYSILHKKIYNYKIQPKHARKKDMLREIFYSSQTTIVFTLIAFGILYTPLKKYTLVYETITDYSYWWLGTCVVASLIVHDTYFYWMHRLLHHPKIYKLAHIVHHKSVNPSPWTSYSFHLLEAVPEGLILLVLVFLFPMHRVTILLFTIIGFIINVYGHLGYEIAPKWLRKSLLFNILNTSVHHNLHHSHFRGNYGLYFRFWDRIMKTENPDYVKIYDQVQQKRFAPGKIKSVLSEA
jgi:lathosterol oxidase